MDRKGRSVRPDGPALLILETEVTGNNFAKQAFAKSAKLYQNSEKALQST